MKEYKFTVLTIFLLGAFFGFMMGLSVATAVMGKTIYNVLDRLEMQGQVRELVNHCLNLQGLG